jgi:hypothetical protein
LKTGGGKLMRRLYIGVIIVILTLVVVAVILVVPAEKTGLQQVAAVFLGILGGAAAVAEIVGLFDRLWSLFPKFGKAHGDRISTRGNYSPGKVGGDFVIGQTRSTKRKARKRRDEQETSDTIDTRGEFSPGKISGDYIASKADEKEK